MPIIRKIIRLENHDTYGIVYVLMEDGDEEYRIFIGGDCEAYHHFGQNKAFIKKPPVDKSKPKVP